ncbi:sensor domain-containing diguanylate cyclase [Kushneria sp. TE3]|uniref:sensor domain-containing diguanylate cyclase n=1 Tax=Kushneria sp. TE3 TaxID=3449832 RepID=UPI003F686B0B
MSHCPPPADDCPSIEALDKLNIAALVYRCGERVTLEGINESARALLNHFAPFDENEPWQWYPDEQGHHPAHDWYLDNETAGQRQIPRVRWLRFNDGGRRMALGLTGCRLADDGPTQRIMMVVQDCTQQIVQHEELRRSQECISSIINATPMGICVLTEDGRFEMVNPAYCRFHGYEEHELIGRPFSMVVPYSSHQYLLRQQHGAQGSHHGHSQQFGECELVARHGERHTVIVESVRIEGEDGRPRDVIFLVDISERKKLEMALEEKNVRLEYLATHDELTGIRNRRFGISSLEAALEQAERQGLDISVALLDIDHFKRVNDDYGHTVGDQVLQQFAEVLSRQLRASDILVRWGGEEFMLILPGIDQCGALQALERLRQTLSLEYLGPRGLQVTFSAGIINARGMSSNDLVEGVDQKLYQAKGRGRDRIIS